MYSILVLMIYDIFNTFLNDVFILGTFSPPYKRAIDYTYLVLQWVV